MDSHSEQERPVMPAALVSILSEPGWRSNDWGWYFDVDQSPTGNPGIYVWVDKHAPFDCTLTIDDVLGPEALHVEQVAKVLALMRRIEQVLAGDAAPGAGEAVGK